MTSEWRTDNFRCKLWPCNYPIPNTNICGRKMQTASTIMFVTPLRRRRWYVEQRWPWLAQALSHCKHQTSRASQRRRDYLLQFACRSPWEYSICRHNERSLWGTIHSQLSSCCFLPWERVQGCSLFPFCLLHPADAQVARKSPRHGMQYMKWIDARLMVTEYVDIRRWHSFDWYDDMCWTVLVINSLGIGRSNWFCMYIYN